MCKRIRKRNKEILKQEFSMFSSLNTFLIPVFFFQILEALDTDIYCSKYMLAHKLKNVAFTLDGDEAIAC
jgi:hypothetical protein